MKLSVLSMCLLIIACGKDGNQTIVEKGQDGTNGTTITVVQFCPGTTNYPSTFPEDGFCIDNKIYAVYSANDGFLTEVPPGTYLSNAVGSICTFVIRPGCVIQN